MADYSLVPVNYQPDFENASLVPFGTNDMIQQPPLAPSPSADPNGLSVTDGPDSLGPSQAGSGQQYSMASHAAYSRCVDKCLHLLSSPSGDLQSSEFRLCVAQCMGRL